MTFASREALAAFLGRHKLIAEKALGQHFLADPAVVAAMVGALADARPELGPAIRSVLEIGPGPGILTGPLLDRFGAVSYLEIDERMKAPLADSAPTALAHFGDAMQADLAALLAPLETPRALASNLPYYITAPLVERFTAQRDAIARLVLMMQKEVGDRIAAPPGKGERGSLSVSLQRLFTITKIADVPPESFLPPPKVRSVVLLLVPRRDVAADPAFERLVRAGFAQPRKTLANNLAALFGDPGGKERGTDALERADIPPNHRPHQLDEPAWLRLQWALDA